MLIGRVVLTPVGPQLGGVCILAMRWYPRNVRNKIRFQDLPQKQNIEPCLLLVLKYSGSVGFSSISVFHNTPLYLSMLTTLVLFVLQKIQSFMNGPSTSKLIVISFVMNIYGMSFPYRSFPLASRLRTSSRRDFLAHVINSYPANWCLLIPPHQFERGGGGVVNTGPL